MDKLVDLLAEGIRLTLEAKEMTQTDFAKRLGVTRAAVSKILLSKRNPSLSSIGDIAKALNVPAFTLLMPEDDLKLWTAAKSAANNPAELHAAISELAKQRIELARIKNMRRLEDKERELYEKEIALLKKEISLQSTS